MCGIVGYVGAQQAAPILLEGLQKLEYRGYDSAGIAVLDGSTIELAKACGEIKNLLAKTHDGSDLHGYIGLGHTRWATHGAPTEANAHPHVSNDGKFAIVQNGIIENFMELREMLQAKGFRFHSETDTEVIVHLLDMYYTGDGNLKDTVMKTLGRLEGSYAIGILCADCPEQMFLARNGCPLIIGVGAGENFFASDVTALVSHTKNVVYLDDGELAEVHADGYTVFDCTGKPVHKPVSRVAWDIEAAEKGGYEHFMLKEIMEQPKAVADTVKPRIKNDAVVFEDNGLTDERLREIEHIHIIGCGDEVQCGQLCGICLGGRNRNLRAGPGIQHTVCFARNRRGNDVYDRNRERTCLLGQTHGSQRICRLAGLADNDAHILFADDRVLITELTGNLCRAANAAHRLNHALADHACMQCRAAADDMNMLDLTQTLVGRYYRAAP